MSEIHSAEDGPSLYTLIKALDYGNTHPGVRID
jgi:hypothetical protein